MKKRVINKYPNNININQNINNVGNECGDGEEDVGDNDRVDKRKFNKGSTRRRTYWYV
jgi:hypothetical protein